MIETELNNKIIWLCCVDFIDTYSKSTLWKFLNWLVPYINNSQAVIIQKVGCFENLQIWKVSFEQKWQQSLKLYGLLIMIDVDYYIINKGKITIDFHWFPRKIYHPWVNLLW
jgi:hypothetical protein